MQRFQTALIAMFALIVVATIAAIWDGGIDLIIPFLEPIIALTWQGQFNIDFTCYLVLSGIWMAWRGGFSRRSIALGVLAPPLGILFFAPYLLYLIRASDGDAKKLLLGVHAASA